MLRVFFFRFSIIFLTYCQFCTFFYLKVGIVVPLTGVPYQFRSLSIPALGRNCHILEIDLQTILDVATCIGIAGALVLSTEYTTLESGIVGTLSHVGIVASAHELLEDVQSAGYIVDILAGNTHTTYITTAVERTNGARVVDVFSRVIICQFVEHDGGLQRHSDGIHIVCHHRRVQEIHGTELLTIALGIFSVFIDFTCIQFQIIRIDHAGTVVAEEHIVDSHIRAHLQFHLRFRHLGGQTGTVASEIDRAFDERRFCFGTDESDGHLLGIGTERFQDICRRQRTDTVIEIFEGAAVGQTFIVGIRIGTIAAAINIASDAGVHGDSITAIDSTSHVVTAIYIVDVTAKHSHTGREASGEFISGERITSNRDAVLRWHHIRHTATAIEVVDDEGRVILDFKQQAFRTGHGTLITTTVEVTYLTTQQVPRRTNMHLRQIVTTKEAPHLELAAAGLREGCVDAHLQESVLV